jgi:pyruvate kinase
MRRRKTRIIVTIGPATAGDAALRALRARGVDFVRTNMSHSSVADLERAIAAARRAGIPFVIDTEGSQVRSGDLREQVVRFEDNDELRLWSGPEPGDRGGLQLKPPAILDQLEPGDLLHVDFDTLVLRVTDTSTAGQGFVTARTVSGGWVGRNKAVVVDPLSPRPLRLPVLSEKDLESIKIGLREGVGHIAVSFVRSGAAVEEVRAVTQGRMQIISKIECVDALERLPEIIERSDLLLIDRGDLSKEVALERIPFVQKLVIHEATARGRGVYVATNLLETMVEKRNPTRAEVQDVVNTVLDGAAGLTLAAETAIGRFPIECVTMLDRLVEHTESALRRAAAAGPPGAGIAAGLRSAGYLADPDPWPALPAPLGGTLVNRIVAAAPEAAGAGGGYPVVRLSARQRADLELIACGAYSPLRGFMGPEDVEAVATEMILADGTPWPLPVVLEVAAARASELPSRGTIALADEDGGPIGCMELERVDTRGSRLVDAALDRAPSAPGTALLSGPAWLFAHRASPTRRYELSPRQTRSLFQARSWRRILGDWWLAPDEDRMRAVRRAMDETSCDGLFVQAILEDGAGAATAFRACEAAVETAQRREAMLVAALGAAAPPTGVRGLLHGALVRLNFGCTHVLLDPDAAAEVREAMRVLEPLGVELVDEPAVAVLEDVHRGSDAQGGLGRASGTVPISGFGNGDCPPPVLRP